MAELLSYTPPPHMDACALLQRGVLQLQYWHLRYGEHQPEWLPPAGDVRWLEDAVAYLHAHALPTPTPGVTTVEPSASVPLLGGER